MSRAWQIAAVAVGMALPVGAASTWLVLHPIPFQALLRLVLVFGTCAAMSTIVSTRWKEDVVPWSMFAGLVYGCVVLAASVLVIVTVALFDPQAVARLGALTPSPLFEGGTQFSYALIVPVVSSIALVILIIVMVMTLWAGAVAAVWAGRRSIGAGRDS